MSIHIKPIGKRIGVYYLTIFVLLVLTNNGFGGEEWKDPVVGSDAPTFSLMTPTGERIYLRDYCGVELRQPWKSNVKYPVVISFFSSICEPCKNEIAELHKLNEKYGEKVKFLLVNVGESNQEVKKCLDERGYTLPTLIDQYLVVSKMYGNPQVVPKLAVVDKEGKLAFFVKGYEAENMEKLEKLLEKLVSD